MAYTLTYWEEGKDKDTHYELRSVRLKSINEAFPLALPHNRPNDTALITVERHRKRGERKWIDEKIVWEKGMKDPIDVVKRPDRTKRGQ